MEINYTDAEGDETPIEPIRFEAEPLLYHVPSTFIYEGTKVHETSWVDWYTHAFGWKLSVERYLLEFEGNEFPDGYTMIADRAKEIPTCTVRPARLQSGFSMITYMEPSDEGDHFARLCCELCSVRGNLLAVVLYAGSIPIPHVKNPEIIFHARIIKQMAKMTEWFTADDE